MSNAIPIPGQTATGDAIVGPGCPTVLVGALPASVMGDSVNGAAIAGGVITAGVPNVLLGGRPATVVGSAAAGPNPATGVPVATTAASPPVATVIFG